jgi:hypothetical protein
VLARKGAWDCGGAVYFEANIVAALHRMGQLVNFFPLNITTLHHTILGSSQIKDSIPLDTSTWWRLIPLNFNIIGTFLKLGIFHETCTPGGYEAFGA